MVRCSRSSSAPPWGLARRHELRQAGDPLGHLLHAQVPQRAGELVAAEDAHAGGGTHGEVGQGCRERPPLDAREQGHPAAGREHADDLLQGLQRPLDQVERGEAAHGVERAGAEGQVLGVAPEVGEVALGRPRRTLGQHGPRGVDAHREPVPHLGREGAREVARAAAHVQHAVARAEPQHLHGDQALLVHARPEGSHQEPPAERPPQPLVDEREGGADHQALPRQAAGGIVLAQAGRRNRRSRPRPPAGGSAEAAPALGPSPAVARAGRPSAES